MDKETIVADVLMMLERIPQNGTGERVSHITLYLEKEAFDVYVYTPGDGKCYVREVDGKGKRIPRDIEVYKLREEFIAQIFTGLRTSPPAMEGLDMGGVDDVNWVAGPEKLIDEFEVGLESTDRGTYVLVFRIEGRRQPVLECDGTDDEAVFGLGETLKDFSMILHALSKLLRAEVGEEVKNGTED